MSPNVRGRRKFETSSSRLDHFRSIGDLNLSDFDFRQCRGGASPAVTAYGSLGSFGVEAGSVAGPGSVLRGFFTFVDLLGGSFWLSLFSLLSDLVSVLLLAFSDFFAGSSAVFLSLFDSALLEGLDFSLAGPRVLSGAAFGEEGGAVIGGTGLRSGVPCGDGIGLTDGLAAAVGAAEADAAAVGAAFAVVVVLVLVTPTLSCASKRGAAIP